MSKKAVLAFLVVALVTLACGINIDLPITDAKTGPTQTEEISVPFLGSQTDTAKVTLAFGAGILNINPGGEDALLSGTATFNVDDFRPELTINDNVISLEQGNMDLDGIPTFSDDVVNQWDLVFGGAPLELVINAGAYSGRYELGGLSLERLEINDGAADVKVSFSEQNTTEMSLFEYSTGASTITLEGLANTNCSQMVFHSGAGTYTLDFSGTLARDMSVSIESGVSSVTIIIPDGTAAVLTSSGNLLSVNSTGSWVQDGNRYSLSGEGYTISFDVEMGAGSLTLESK